MPATIGRVVTLVAVRALLILGSALLIGVEVEPARAEDAGTCERVVVSGDADYQPLSWFDGEKMQGAAETIVSAALDHLHVPYEIRYVGPFKRMLAEAEAGEIDVVAELKKTEERQNFLEFSSTPIFVNPVAIFTHRLRNLNLPRMQDLVGLRGGMVIANQFGGDLDRMVQHELTIEEVPRLDLGLGMLRADRLDYFITSYYPGMSYLLDQGLTSIFTVQRPFPVATDNFVGLSRKSRCLTRLAPLDGELARMAMTGELKRLFDGATEDWRQRAHEGE